ncbi:unnamed protein product [Durusdinium trenchii]|uniref:Prolyl 4-hydroxylase alpha subunit Fe(2+) 2OG dioxygenase domain-containing protein n=1 Tax=Durusdinium trenchii TaxID=1381693 RepID=A0ABP0LEM0_9DINO
MDWEPVREKLVAAVKDLSIGHPYVVIDGLLGGWAKALAEEADSLEFASKLLPHTFQFFAGGQQHFFKHPGRRYLDLDAARQEGQPTSLTSHAPRLMRFAVDMLPDLVASLRAAVPKLGLAETAPHVKLQLTTGEVGCTPCHYDTSYNDPTSLQLSILIYLSEGWCPEWGGELQLVPFLEPPVLLAAPLLTPSWSRGAKASVALDRMAGWHEGGCPFVELLPVGPITAAAAGPGAAPRAVPGGLATELAALCARAGGPAEGTASAD